jgi:hypothetical protein
LGLDVNAIRFILDARAGGASFERVATIGRQTLQIDRDTLAGLLTAYGMPTTADDAARILAEAGNFCEPLLKYIGACEIDSIDFSPYQDASCLHDMNDPIPPALKNRFSVVIDGGSLEHVFNFPRAIANCMEMTQAGGRYLATTPTNNFMGHGFYQFSPELYYRVFSPENGFVVERMVIYEECWPFVWHDVLDPEQVRRRVTLINRYPTYLLVQGRRVEVVAPFARAPQQSDYVVIWQESTGGTRRSVPATNGESPTGLRRAIRVGVGRLVPEALKASYRRIRQGKNPFDPRLFKKVERSLL